jgi:hypothetical protein
MSFFDNGHLSEETFNLEDSGIILPELEDSVFYDVASIDIPAFDCAEDDPMTPELDFSDSDSDVSDAETVA